jgi:type IV pilus assembly protein PilM
VFRRKATFGLDIGSSTVKAVQLRRTNRGIELERFAAVPIYPNGRRTADVDVRTAKIAAVQRAVAAAKISARNVVSSVSGESIIVRYIQLPVMTEEELRNALRYEAEEYIPFHIDEVNLDSHILGVTEDNGTKRLNVLLVAAKRDIIAEHVNIIRGAGLVPEIVDVDSFALFNCFEHAHRPGADEVVLLIDVGAEVSNINIFHKGQSQFARDINIGGESITQAVQQKLNIDYSEAEHLKFAEGVHMSAAAARAEVDDDTESPLINSLSGAIEGMTGDELGDDRLENQSSRVIRNSLNTLLAEIRRSVQFFENQVSGQTVTRMVLSGGTSKLPNVLSHFQQELGVPVTGLDPMQGLSVNRRNVDENVLENCRAVLGVGIGLALRKVA